MKEWEYMAEAIADERLATLYLDESIDDDRAFGELMGYYGKEKQEERIAKQEGLRNDE